MNLAMAGWLACSHDPRSYASRSLMLLAGPTKLDRSLGEGPDKACIPVFQARGFDSWFTTRNCKKLSCYGNCNEDINYCDGLPQSSDLYEWQKWKAERKLLTGKRKSSELKQRPGLDSGMFIPCMRLAS